MINFCDPKIVIWFGCRFGSNFSFRDFLKVLYLKSALSSQFRLPGKSISANRFSLMLIILIL